jgi:hypothetical protein
MEERERYIYIHTYIPLTLYPRRGSRGISDIAPRPTFYQNYLAVRNTEERGRYYFFILSRTPHETTINYDSIN